MKLIIYSCVHLVSVSRLRDGCYNIIVIMKTYLYNFDPLKPHFYIVKLGFTGVLISAPKNIDCGYLLEPPLYFEQKYEKYQNFYLITFSFWW